MQSQNPTADRPTMNCATTIGPRHLHIGFVMSTELGLRTQYLNWRDGLAEPDIDPEWIIVEWWHPTGLFRPLGRRVHSVIVRLAALRDMRMGLARGPFDGLVLAGHMLFALQPELQKQPYFLVLDTTRKQLADFGELYGKGPSPIRLVERRRHRGRCTQYRGAAAMFPWSHWCANSIIEDYGVDPTRVHVIPPGVDMDYWRCEPRSNQGPVNMLFVGSNFLRKGGDLLMHWAKNTKLRDWNLHIVTRDEISSDDPRIHIYTGLTPNSPALRQLYEQADLFVLPTRGDCYSIASIEAMAAGLPVILTRTGGTGDIITDGVTGYLIEVGDEAAMAERLEYLLAEPERRIAMGVAARADAEQRYDLRENIHQTVQTMRRYIQQ